MQTYLNNLKERKLCENTQINYISNIKVISKRVFNNDWLPFEYFDKDHNEETTRKINEYLNTLKENRKVNVTRAIYDIILFYQQGVRSDISDYWRNKNIKISEEVKFAVIDQIGKPTQKEEDAFLPWSEILAKIGMLEAANQSDPWNKKLHTKLMLLHLYTQMTPIRISEWTECRIAINPTEDQINQFNMFNYNYINTKTSQFIINNHKTKKTYGRKILNVPDSLMKLIIDYFELWHHTNYLLLNDQGKPYKNTSINRLLYEIFDGKKVSTNLLRKIFLSHHAQNSNYETRSKIIKEQGHNPLTSMMYYTDFMHRTIKTPPTSPTPSPEPFIKNTPSEQIDIMQAI